MKVKNLLASVPSQLPDELSETLIEGTNVRVERIVSRGHSSPEGFWYDQDESEWVLVVSGRARLRFEDLADPVEMGSGDFLEIAAHRRHRVDWTDPDQDTVWLAIFHSAQRGPGRSGSSDPESHHEARSLMKPEESIRAILVRELRTLQRELEAYEDESQIWALPPGITNSAGTLALHVAGNLQAFVGAVLGGSGYVRDRRAEFQRRDTPRAELLAEIDTTIQAVGAALATLPAEKLDEPFPLEFGDLQVVTGDFLCHLSAHLAFHVGQVDYHRRVVTGDSTSVAPVAIPELASALPRK